MNYCFLRFPDFKKKALTLSYDDGSKYDEKLVDIFNKYGLKCTFNICSGKMAENNGWHLSETEAVALYKGSEHEVAVHGVKHLSLPELPNSEIIKEIAEDREKLEKIFERIIRGMAYAYGHYNDKVVNILKETGIVYSRTIKSTGSFVLPDNWFALNPTCHHNDDRIDDYCDKFLIKDNDDYDVHSFWSNGPKLFYLWGHSHEFERDGNWSRIENFAKKMSCKEDVWYATNMQIYEYVNAYESLIWSYDGKRVFNPWIKDIFINYYGEKIVIKSGETLDL